MDGGEISLSQGSPGIFQELLQKWNWISGRNRLAFALDCLLKGYGQIFLGPSPLSGFVVMAVLFAFSWQIGVSSLVGLISATTTAWLLGQNPYLLRLGLYGFNGAMVGWLWGYLLPPYSPFLLLIPAPAAVSTLLMIGISRWGEKKGLPALSFPFVIVIWISLLTFYHFKVLPFNPAIVPSLSTSSTVEWKTSLEYLKTIVEGVALFWIGIFIYSRITSLMFLMGLGLGLAISLLLGGPNGSYWIGLYAFTTAPLAMACGGLFFHFNRGAIYCALIAIGVGSILWWVLSFLLSPFGLYPLTASFNITLWLLLLPGVQSLLLKRLGIVPVPLPRVTRPEDRLRTKFQENGQQIEAASNIIRSSSKIVVLAGAGLSTESGIPDYRSPGGYWSQYDPADIQYDRFRTDQSARLRYWQASSKFYEMIRWAQPNTGHLALAELEKQGVLLGIITQNVDGLHHKAGNSIGKILEIHGTEHVISCLECQAQFARWEPGPWSGIDVEAPLCPHCNGLLKPDSILFGQPISPAKLEQAILWLTQTDLLLIIGSSLNVQPVASFPRRAKEMGARVMIINLSPTEDDGLADVAIHGQAGPVLSRIVQQLKRRSLNVNIHPLSRNDYFKICQVADAWYGDSVSWLLHPIYVEHFSGTSFVAEMGGRMVGFILGFISQDHPEVAHVHMVATDPGVRRQGIGRILYQRFFETGIQRGCLTVMAIAAPHNHGSISFHSRLGFSLCEKGATWINGYPVMKDYAGPGFDCLVLERSLADPFPL